MIQDIFPCRLDHAFRDREPEPEDCFFSFRGGEVLLRVSEDGSRRIPVFHDLGLPFAEVRRLAVFLFCVDGVPVYLLRQQGNILPEREGIPAQVSMEERMACGIGACLGCAVKIQKPGEKDWQYLRVCRDGPVPCPAYCHLLRGAVRNRGSLFHFGNSLLQKTIAGGSY